MKKIIYSLALVIGFGTTQVFAQKTTFGLKTGANLSNFRVSDMPGVKNSLGIGANLGGFTKVEFSESFALQPELMISFKNSKLEQNGTQNKIQSWGVQVPVYAMFQLPESNTGRAYLGVGPYGSYGIKAKNKTTDVNLYKKNGADKAYLKRFDAGLAATIGYEFTNKMQLNASYKFGLLDELKADSNNAKLKNQEISLGVGYRF